MGGALTAGLAADHPEIAGIVCINAVVTPPEGMAEGVQALLDQGEETMEGIGSDIADPDVGRARLPADPPAPAAHDVRGREGFEGRLAKIACPVLVMNSPQDHVVPPENSDLIAEGVAGPVERVTLERSYHVATQDYDKDLVNAEDRRVRRSGSAPHPDRFGAWIRLPWAPGRRGGEGVRPACCPWVVGLRRGGRSPREPRVAAVHAARRHDRADHRGPA